MFIHAGFCKVFEVFPAWFLYAYFSLFIVTHMSIVFARMWLERS